MTRSRSPVRRRGSSRDRSRSPRGPRRQKDRDNGDGSRSPRARKGSIASSISSVANGSGAKDRPQSSHDAPTAGAAELVSSFILASCRLDSG